MYGYVTCAVKFIFEASLLSYCAVIIVVMVIMKFKSKILSTIKLHLEGMQDQSFQLLVGGSVFHGRIDYFLGKVIWGIEISTPQITFA